MMMTTSPTRRWGLLLLPVALTLARPAAAGDCESPRTQREIEACTRVELASANEELEAVLAALKTALDGGHRGRLEKAQEAWRRYRDANCQAAAAAYEGGTLSISELDGCHARLASARVAELKLIYREPPFGLGPHEAK